jgi:hypothetical protein
MVIRLLDDARHLDAPGPYFDGLAQVPELLAALTANPDRLTALPAHARSRLLAETCTPAARDTLKALAAALPTLDLKVPLRDADACIARRAALAPRFAAWLGR